MYSTHNEGKSVVAERFIRTLKTKLYKHMTAIGKNVYYDVLDDKVNKYINAKHSTIKMKPIDVGNNKRVYIDEHNDKRSTFKVGDRVRISKFKNIFAKGYTPNWSSEIFIVDKVKLDLTNYATKDDVKNITHVDVSGYATKTNLASLKTEVDKIDTDKLKTVPADLAKLSNVKNDVVKKTDYSTKVTSIEAQIAGLTKNTVDNLADITKLKAIDTNSFVLKTKFSADINTLDDKIDGVEKKTLI